MPEIISTPHALVQTTNGKRFYVYSGVVSVSSSETSMIDIANIGERDILIHLELGVDSVSSPDLTIRVKSNDITIFINKYDNLGLIYGGNSTKLKFILPANTKFEVTLILASSSFNMSVAGHGKFV